MRPFTRRKRKKQVTPACNLNKSQRCVLKVLNRNGSRRFKGWLKSEPIIKCLKPRSAANLHTCAECMRSHSWSNNTQCSSCGQDYCPSHSTWWSNDTGLECCSHLHLSLNSTGELPVFGGIVFDSLFLFELLMQTF